MAIRTALKRFGFVTVMNPKFYAVGSTAGEDNEILEIDTLRISNITQEGPTKTAKGGLYAETLMRYGKTMRLEMEDVIGRIDVLEHLMGAYVGTDVIKITDRFASAYKIVGKTFVINPEDGTKQWITLTIHNFLPDSVFEQTMEAEGDFGAINIGGEITPNHCGTFYEIELLDNADCDLEYPE